MRSKQQSSTWVLNFMSWKKGQSLGKQFFPFFALINLFSSLFYLSQLYNAILGNWNSTGKIQYIDIQSNFPLWIFMKSGLWKIKKQPFVPTEKNVEVTLFFINTLDNQLKLFQHLLITFSFNHFFSGLGFYSLTIKIKTSHEIMRTDAEVSLRSYIFTTQDEKNNQSGEANQLCASGQQIQTMWEIFN